MSPEPLVIKSKFAKYAGNEAYLPMDGGGGAVNMSQRSLATNSLLGNPLFQCLIMKSAFGPLITYI